VITVESINQWPTCINVGAVHNRESVCFFVIQAAGNIDTRIANRSNPARNEKLSNRWTPIMKVVIHQPGQYSLTLRINYFDAAGWIRRSGLNCGDAAVGYLNRGIWPSFFADAVKQASIGNYEIRLWQFRQTEMSFKWYRRSFS